MGTVNSIDEYIAQFPSEQQERMQRLRAIIHAAYPGLEEKISWGMPTFVLNKNVVHFAQHQKHLGFYPGDSGISAFREKLESFACSKGAVRLPMNQPLPEKLITEIVRFRAEENRHATQVKRRNPKTGPRMTLPEILSQLNSLGTEQTRKTYRRHGAKEPLFGVTAGAMKPLVKQIGRDQELAMELYATGNYDAMTLAGMVADPTKITEQDMEAWMETAYCHGLHDYVVAVTLAETNFAQRVADRWISSREERYQSAGWSCYEWLLGSRPDIEFDRDKLSGMLEVVKKTIHTRPNWVRYAMNGFVIAVGISYLPLHDEAVAAAEHIGRVEVEMGPTSCKTPLASDYIRKAAEKGRLGFKRRKVRC